MSWARCQARQLPVVSWAVLQLQCFVTVRRMIRNISSWQLHRGVQLKRICHLLSFQTEENQTVAMRTKTASVCNYLSLSDWQGFSCCYATKTKTDIEPITANHPTQMKDTEGCSHTTSTIIHCLWRRIFQLKWTGSSHWLNIYVNVRNSNLSTTFILIRHSFPVVYIGVQYLRFFGERMILLLVKSLKTTGLSYTVKRTRIHNLLYSYYQLYNLLPQLG